MDNQNFETDQINQQDQVNHKKGRGIMKLVWFIVLVAIIVFAILGVYKFINKSDSSSEYSAVFLNNDQVYFGKLSNKNSDYVVLDDVFYLRVNKVLQKDDKGNQIAVPDINLIKLGTELHKPKDRMEINKDGILFIQTLTENSDVIKAISSYKQKQQENKK